MSSCAVSKSFEVATALCYAMSRLGRVIMGGDVGEGSAGPAPPHRQFGRGKRKVVEDAATATGQPAS